jgi:glycosyltransferase involved in cell wall biosynthesis
MKPLYNHEMAISSLRFLNKKIKSSYTFVFLDKNSEDSAYVKSIEELMNQYTDIKFLFLERQNEKSFCHLLKSARLVVITAKSDGSPVTAMQAMAFGIPVILPPLKYDDEIFGEWIYKLDSWDEKALANKITTALSDIFEGKKIKSRDVIRKFADYETEMTKLLDLYNSHVKKI